MTTKRAQRLGKFLEKELGWSVYSNSVECPNGHIVYEGKFCSECGAKLKQIRDTNSDDQLELAIKHLLKEKK